MALRIKFNLEVSATQMITVLEVFAACCRDDSIIEQLECAIMPHLGQKDASEIVNKDF